MALDPSRIKCRNQDGSASFTSVSEKRKVQDSLATCPNCRGMRENFRRAGIRDGLANPPRKTSEQDG